MLEQEPLRDEEGKVVDPKDIDGEAMASAWEEAFEDIVYVPPLKKFVRASKFGNKAHVCLFYF